MAKYPSNHHAVAGRSVYPGNDSKTPYDRRTNHGYGKAQKIPSFGTGIGSMRSMGSSDTGIYPEEDDFDYEEIDMPFDSEEDAAKFISKINLNYKTSDSVRPRADMSSLGHSSNKFSTVGLSEQAPIPKASDTISPFSRGTLYPNGLGSATGGSSTQHGSTTIAPGKKGGDGTKFGFSRKPLDAIDDGIRFLSIVDLFSLPIDERNFLKQQIKLKKALYVAECLEKQRIYTHK